MASITLIAVSDVVVLSGAVIRLSSWSLQRKKLSASLGPMLMTANRRKQSSADRIVCNFAASMLTGYGQHGCHGSRAISRDGNRLAWDVLKQHHGHPSNSSNGVECRTSHWCRQPHSKLSGIAGSPNYSSRPRNDATGGRVGVAACSKSSIGRIRE
jgi:hypothetical protein